MVIDGGALRRWMTVALQGLPARAGGVEATFAKGPIASDDRQHTHGRQLLPGDGAPVLCFACAGLAAPIAGPRPQSPPFGGWPYASDSVMEDAGSIRQRTEAVTANTGRDVMRLTFKLHATSPPFVELCLETWRQDVHGGAPIISPHLTTAGEIKKSCANFRAQIDRVEQEAIAALHGIKKKG